MKRPSPQLFNGLFSGRFARFIVILFLVYAGVDIANPQLCSDDFAPASALLTLNIEKRAEELLTGVSIGESEKSEQREELPEPHSEDDCFCCCTHVLPGVTTHPNGASDAISQGLISTPQTVSSAHLMALYHPPRAV